MVEILLDLLAIDIVHILVRYSEDSAPALVAFGELGVFRIEDPIEECEVVGDFFIAIDMKPVLGLLDSCCEIRHVEDSQRTGK